MICVFEAQCECFVFNFLKELQRIMRYCFLKLRNKKVLLRERKRHTTRRVANARPAALLMGGGYSDPVLTWGVPPSSPNRVGGYTCGTPISHMGYLPVNQMGYPLPISRMGYPPVGKDGIAPLGSMGVPHPPIRKDGVPCHWKLGRMGVPPPHQPVVVPPPTPTRVLTDRFL